MNDNLGSNLNAEEDGQMLKGLKQNMILVNHLFHHLKIYNTYIADLKIKFWKISRFKKLVRLIINKKHFCENSIS